KAVELNRDILGVTDGPRGGEQIDLALAGRTEGNGVADHDADALGLGFLEGGRFGDDAVLEMEYLAARTDFLDERRRIEPGAGNPEHVGLVEHRFRSVFEKHLIGATTVNDRQIPVVVVIPDLQ